MQKTDKEALYAEWARELSESELNAVVDDAKRTGILLVKSPNRDVTGAPGCWLGGEPHLPPEIEWPYFEENGVPQAPMHFLAQINLAELPPESVELGLPQTGTLFFFYDTIVAPLGSLDSGGSKVIYVQEDVSGISPRQTPEMPTVDETSLASFWYIDRPTKGYRQWNISFHKFEGINTGQVNRYASQATLDASGRIRRKLNKHLTDFLASGVDRRNPMPRITINYLLGGTELSSDRSAIPLLTLEEDRDIDFEHAGAILTFWIEVEDLRQGRFDRVFLTER
ncbi:DUF1963 domain-containing protein [Ruegeria sp. Ofav3-42]|uniref:DUF1963 domain-containing protein n=1 Tax=Ruegeria sp. Ofav3-42 TaxID=2917759 RepID=UPI001EF65B0E|nr:YwqG family protein [Ruegeria sp. Ofav3-42]MCG7518808.1 DUF1963 domain-containing protein [Ruegeria sp. Ofav3-42]